MVKIINTEEIESYIKDGDSIYVTGFGLGGLAEEVATAIEKSFMETGHPKDLSIYWAFGVSNFKKGGINHIAQKFVNAVQQIAFRGKDAASQGQKVLFVTKRAVFKLTPQGLEMSEIAPVVDLQKDILDKMLFFFQPDLTSEKVESSSGSEVIELAYEPVELVQDS